MILKPKNHWIFSKTSILQQKFNFFCKIWVADGGGGGGGGGGGPNCGAFDLIVFISSQWSQHSTLLTCGFFCDKFISSSTFVLDKSFNCFNFLSYGVTHSLISLSKSCDNKASQINIFTNKLDNSDITTILWTFLLILILNQSSHQTHVASYPFFLSSHLSCFFAFAW